jgi:hypothetical protein
MAALAAVDEDEATAIEVDDDEVPTHGKRKRNMPTNRELYDQFTDKGFDKANIALPTAVEFKII